eukprot:CAMPEP_0185727858 /NCGR_PEP_ID=MMETSP1171-20130828/3420_1 /TAXON_ID=374046 /ORGANISM="Helicotheca tamensis, Strain CCMP826" /LENGTH=109 /DNA_ID=CAMNT_0028396497 /DNA_START=174 /DNA_END=503 /DNA_ORIENTATION=+
MTDKELTIKRYYFPSGQSKTIQLESIKRVWEGNDPDLGLGFLTKKSWGIAFSNVWWSCNMGREFRKNDNNFVVSTDEKFRYGFSVVDREKVRSALASFMVVAEKDEIGE